MTHYNEPIEEFLENARWRLFDGGHYRHADKMDEVLKELDTRPQEEEHDDLKERYDDSESERERYCAALQKIRKIAIEDPALSDIVGIIDDAI